MLIIFKNFYSFLLCILIFKEILISGTWKYWWSISCKYIHSIALFWLSSSYLWILVKLQSLLKFFLSCHWNFCPSSRLRAKFSISWHPCWLITFFSFHRILVLYHLWSLWLLLSPSSPCFSTLTFLVLSFILLIMIRNPRWQLTITSFNRYQSMCTSTTAIRTLCFLVELPTKIIFFILKIVFLNLLLSIGFRNRANDR